MQTSEYEQFLQRKLVAAPKTGFDCGSINPLAKPFQADIIRWALKRGRAAIFADTGLGKTFMQLEWARHVAENYGKVLILAPLAVGAHLSPFMGIGSEGYMSLKHGRRFIGTELKRSYWQVACKNLRQAEMDAAQQGDLFAEAV